MQTQQGLDRLAFFTDAVAAIAMTLLIVPLVELATSTTDKEPDTAAFLRENSDQLLAFVISFVVIAVLWVAHHRIFEQVAAYSPALRVLTLAWAFTIAFLPLPTALASEYSNDRVTTALYIGTMAASSLVLTGIVLVIRHDDTIRRPGDDLNDRSLSGTLSTSVLFVTALVVGVAFPSVGLLALLLLTMSRFVEPIIYRLVIRSSGGVTPSDRSK